MFSITSLLPTPPYSNPFLFSFILTFFLNSRSILFFLKIFFHIFCSLLEIVISIFIIFYSSLTSFFHFSSLLKELCFLSITLKAIIWNNWRLILSSLPLSFVYFVTEIVFLFLFHFVYGLFYIQSSFHLFAICINFSLGEFFFYLFCLISSLTSSMFFNFFFLHVFFLHKSVVNIFTCVYFVFIIYFYVFAIWIYSA